MSKFHELCHSRTSNWLKIVEIIKKDKSITNKSDAIEAAEVYIRNELKNKKFSYPTIIVQSDGQKKYKDKPTKEAIRGEIVPFPMFNISYTVGWWFTRYIITPDQELYDTQGFEIGYRLERERSFIFMPFTYELMDSDSGKDEFAYRAAHSIVDRAFDLYYEYKWLYLMARYVAGYSGGALQLLVDLEIEPKRNYHYPLEKTFALLDKCNRKFLKEKLYDYSDAKEFFESYSL